MILTMANKDPEALDNQTAYGQPSFEPEKELFVWKAAARPFKKREREFWVRLVAIASIFSFILFLAEGVMPVILIISIVFLFYILSSVEPEEIEYKITTRGIKIANQTTSWDSILRFWFYKRLNSDLLVCEVIFVPGRLEIVVDPKDIGRISAVLQKYLPNEQGPQTSLDRASNWLSEKLLGG